MELENKTIWITGASGLIGCNLVDRLMISRNNKIIVTGRNITKLKSTFSDYGYNDNLILIEHDVSNNIPEQIQNIDYIFHAAGPMEREIVMNQPISVILPNTIGTINCLDFLRKQEKKTGQKGRIIIFSSVTVYNNNTDSDLIAIESITNNALSLDMPNACYAESKRMSEVIAKSYVKQFGINAVIARLSTVYGYSRNIPNTAFFEFINNALSGEDIVLSGSGFPRRDNIYVDDAINGLLIIAAKGLIGESYNISSGAEKGNFAAVDEIARYIVNSVSSIKGINPVSVKMAVESRRKPGLILSNDKIKKLNWKVMTSLETGIKNTIEKFLLNVLD
ncbi:MAG: NAD-dependent epimerase/dehydratase family protein [Bacteroidales bacterium]|nr:NAD-dependent epimerase/dehydratase family protein [Bacteroidales bacterium]